VCVAIIVAAAGLAIWQLHDDRVADEIKNSKNLAVVLAEQTARTFQAVDLVVQETQAMVLAAGVTDPDQFRQRMSTEEVYHFLLERLRSLPQADGVTLKDDAGTIINSSRSWPAKAINVSDHETYRYLRDHSDSDSFIGIPTISRTTGAWEILLSRRVSGARGEFLGFVSAAIELKYFENFYQAVSTSAGESIAVFRRDGTLLARYPRIEKMIGQPVSAQSPWHEAVASRGGTYRTPGYLDGIPRIVSVQPLHDYPVVVTVTTSELEALAPWRHQSVLIAICAFGAAIGFATLFRALAVQFGKLEQGEARFRDFAETSSDWFWETDEDHRISYMSEDVSTTGFGVTPSFLVGRTRMEIAADAGAHVQKWKEHHALLESHEGFRDFTYTWTNPGGQGTASISGAPHFDRKGRFLGYRGTGRDISSQIRAERSLRDAKEAAEAANIAKSQFLANTSHELRTPLNAIIGFSEMLERGIAGPLRRKQKEYAGLVHESGQHLLNVINDILDLAHVDSGKFELRPEPGIDCRSIIDGCVSLLRDRAQAGGLQLSTDIEDQLPLLVADPTRLKQILLNLISNAVKFTEPGGAVTVAGRHDGEGGIVLEVRDTGPGMMPEEIEIALEPFGQVDASHTRRHEGTGLGLPLARRLAELHGGSLRISSQKGMGTTVSVTIPASGTAGDTAAEPGNAERRANVA
jgi:PAS domain S-box-containing protein